MSFRKLAIMDRKNLIIGGVLAGIIIFLLGIWLFISINSVNTDNSITLQENAVFNAKTPEEKAVFVARLNEGALGFAHIEGTNKYVITVTNVSLTPDGKYWVVNLHEHMNEKDDSDGYIKWIVTIDAKTLMSKSDDGYGEFSTWRSLDELAASYIAQIQTVGANGGSEIHKITMNGREVWKITNYYYHEQDPRQVQDIYVDVATGKSKNTWDCFKDVSGTGDWLSLKEVDNVLNEINYTGSDTERPFKDALRDFYSE